MGYTQMKMIANKETIVTADNRTHAILQFLLFFECNSWQIDFNAKTFIIEDVQGVIDD